MAEDGSKIDVVLVDDDPFALRGLTDQISAEPDMRVVGAVSSCEEAVGTVRSEGADVIIAEGLLPGGGCMDLLGELRRHEAPVGLLVLTRSESGDDALRLVQAGATAYLSKSASSADLLSAVRTVAGGGRVLEPRALSAVLEDYRSYCGTEHSVGVRAVDCERERDEEKAPQLTRREREVLTLIARGRSMREIAGDLSLSQKTVEVHRSHIMEKLDLHKVARLVRYALRERLVEFDLV